MVIELGRVKTLSVENWRVIPDDRQTMYEVIGGVVVQDFGHVADGDKISCKIAVQEVDAPILVGYWHNREPINVVDEAGHVWSNRRLVIKSYSYKPYFADVYEAEIELWGV